MQMLRNGLQKLHHMQSSGRQQSILQQGREVTGMMGNLWGCCQTDRNSARRQPGQCSRIMLGRQTRRRKMALQQQHLVLTRTTSDRRQSMIVGQMQRGSNAGQMRTVLTQEQQRDVRSAGQMHRALSARQVQSMGNSTCMMTAGQMQSAMTRQQKQKRVRSLQQMQQQLNWTQRSLNLRCSLLGMVLQQSWEITQCQQQRRHGQVASSRKAQSQTKARRTERSQAVARGWQRLLVKLLPSRAMSTLQVWTV
jgi:hypothetical protein